MLLQLLLAATATVASAAVAADGVSAAEQPRVRPVYLELFSSETAVTALEPGISLRATPTELTSSGSWVQVSWSGLEDATGDEVIAWYSPASAIEDITATAPVKYQFLSANCTAPCSEGTLRFRLLNLRDDEGYAAGLFRGGLAAPVLVALLGQGGGSLVTLPGGRVVFKDPHNEVLHPHLALTGVGGEMRVSWSTGKAPEAAAAPAHGVRWQRLDVGVGGAGGGEGWAAAETVTYAREDMCTAPALTLGFHDPGLLHSVVLTGLAPGGAYEYTISEQFTGQFTMAPDSSSAVRVAVFGDMGTAELDGTLDVLNQHERASLQTVALLQRLLDQQLDPPLSLVLHIGDISYARGFDVQWDEFLDQAAPVASRLPWMVAAGNHERDAPSTSRARAALPRYQGGDSGGECGVPLQARLRMPGAAADAGADALWYGFNYGPIHFTVMNTEQDFQPGSAQRQFIADDLASVDRSVTPWLVFTGHRPMYVDSTGPGADACAPGEAPEGAPCAHDQPVAHELRRALEPLLLRHKVDLALWGHHHSYQRTCHLARGRCQAPTGDDAVEGSRAGRHDYKGPVHLVVGMAGYELTTNTHAQRPAVFEYVNTWEHGIGVLDANATHLTASFYLDATGRLGDSVTLLKPPPRPMEPGAAAAAGRLSNA